jgi:hypothetical protein
MAYVRQAALHETPLVQWEKKIISNGSDFGGKKWKTGYGGAYGGVWRSLRLAGVRSQKVGSLLVFWYESRLHCREYVFIFNLLYKEIL